MGGYRLSFKSRGQVSIELMFILAIILVGIVMVSGAYYQSDTKNQIVYYVKTTAMSGCLYLNSGVVVNASKYSPLNTVVSLYNYSSLQCNVEGVGLTQNGNLINTTVYINCVNSVNSTILSNALEKYIVRSLSSMKGFAYNGSVLSFRSYVIQVGVVVK